ncbi:SGNH/GDSL hydrolase family protein [Butyrivibrio sp. WCD2001]|uniref:SGNH/GDSL hydrolase family protein n=1 Tax=Butyrivibrio sp. WCD2001 TaxID=1280681 RepID=UPI0003FE0385|nr:SGNH/GDSL hydrolase family protein [Butyrivibrio sp. WCD2001]
MKEYRFFKFKRYIAAMLFLVMAFGFAASAGADFSITAKAASKKKHISASIDSNVKVLFIGDSRTVDMFSAKRHEIKGEVHNNITVYAKDGASFGYMKNTLKKVNLSDYDLVVSWMGANDRGNFKKYSSYYKKLNKKKGVNLVLCTIGYSDDRKLGDIGDILYYNNGIMQSYNKELTRWAKKNHVKTIDLYSYTKNHIRARDNNGVHYVPNPTVDLWNYTVKQISKKVENR